MDKLPQSTGPINKGYTSKRVMLSHSTDQMGAAPAAVPEDGTSGINFDTPVVARQQVEPERAPARLLNESVESPPVKVIDPLESALPPQGGLTVGVNGTIVNLGHQDPLGMDNLNWLRESRQGVCDSNQTLSPLGSHGATGTGIPLSGSESAEALGKAIEEVVGAGALYSLSRPSNDLQWTDPATDFGHLTKDHRTALLEDLNSLAPPRSQKNTEMFGQMDMEALKAQRIKALHGTEDRLRKYLES